MDTKTELRLTEITRYEDVEVGRLLLIAGKKNKRWEAIWQTDLRINLKDGHSLPRGIMPLAFRHYNGWVDCPRLKLNHQSFMWMEPLKSSNWIDMGVNLYLCSSRGWPDPLPRIEFVKLINALLDYDIKELTVEPPMAIINDSRFHPDNPMGLVDFWD